MDRSKSKTSQSLKQRRRQRSEVKKSDAPRFYVHEKEPFEDIEDEPEVGAVEDNWAIYKTTTPKFVNLKNEKDDLYQQKGES